MGFGTRKMGDISSPSSCIDSFITPFLRSFSVSLIKKDSYLNENFMSIGYFLRERSLSQISNGILDKVERTYQRNVHSDNLVEINLQKKSLPSESDFFWNLTCLVVFLKANWCSPIWKPWLTGLVNKFLFCVLGLGHISFYNLLIAMFTSMFAFKLLFVDLLYQEMFRSNYNILELQSVFIIALKKDAGKIFMQWKSVWNQTIFINTLLPR